MEVDVTFLIADLSGYTALTEAHGNLHAARVVARYVELAEAALEPGTRLVERVGDELLVAGADPAAAVETALKLRDLVEGEPLFPAVRMGLHRGRVVEAGDRYVGAALNLTARVAAHARAGQILCTAAVAEAAGGLDGVEYRTLGEVSFRNVAGRVALFEVVAGRQREPAVIDPVCRMQVRAEAAPARLPWAGTTYHFCSFECARAFAADPAGYSGG